MTQRNITTLLLLTAVLACAMAQRTTRRGLKAERPADAVASVVADTIANPGADSIVVSGYDKPLRSNIETFFVTNHSRHTITSVRLEFLYLDIKGNMLHSRQCDVPADIPPQSTRQLSVRSWDRQNAFYYRLSATPRSSVATPYDVRCTVLHYLTASHDN